MEKNNNKLKPAGILFRIVGLIGNYIEFAIVTVPIFLILDYFINSNLSIYISLTVGFIIFSIYYIITETSDIFKGNFSKKLNKLQLVNKEGSNLSLRQLIIRVITKAIILILLVSFFYLIIITFKSTHGPIGLNDDSTLIDLFIVFVLIYPILCVFLLKPIFNNNSQTVYDLLSKTYLLIDIEGIKEEEKERFRQILNDPSKLYFDNRRLNPIIVLLVMIFTYILKLFQKNKKSN